MKLALLLALAITTHVREYVDKSGNIYGTSMWRNHEAVSAFTDGWVCYNSTCHRAIPKPTYKEIQ
jgi:hypothetical protein